MVRTPIGRKLKKYEAYRREFRQLDEARQELESQTQAITSRMFTLAQEMGRCEQLLVGLNEAATVVEEMEGINLEDNA